MSTEKRKRRERRSGEGHAKRLRRKRVATIDKRRFQLLRKAGRKIDGQRKGMRILKSQDRKIDQRKSRLESRIARSQETIPVDSR